MFNECSNDKMSIYKHKLEKLRTLQNGDEKNQLEEEISQNLDNYITNCCNELMQLPSIILQNIFTLRSQIISRQKKIRNKKIMIIILTVIIPLFLFGLFYFLNCQLNNGNLIRSLDFFFKLKHKNKIEISLEKVLLGTYNDGTGKDKVKIYVYQNQTKNEITEWNGEIRYSKPNVIKTWIEIKRSKITYETKVVVEGPGYCEVSKEFKREVITDPDGNVSYGDWVQTRQWDSGF